MYQVTAIRWSGGWELHVEGVGVTQCRHLQDAQREVSDYLACALEVEVALGEITVTTSPAPAGTAQP